jgi:hypothetical protein
MVWSSWLQGHVAFSITLNRWRLALVFPCAVTVCCHRVLSPCAVTCAVTVCCHRVLSPCAVTVCCHRVLSRVLSPCAVTVCCHRVLSPCAVTTAVKIRVYVCIQFNPASYVWQELFCYGCLLTIFPLFLPFLYRFFFYFAMCVFFF